MNRYSSLVAILALPSAWACETVESSDVRTSGVLPTIEATAIGDGKTSLYTSLRVGGSLSNTFLDLAEGDVLSVKSGTEEMELTRQKNWVNQVYYTAELAGDEEDKAIEIAFTRATDEDAPSSTLSMPAPFAFTAPAGGHAFVGSTDALEIAWDNSGKDDPLTVTFKGYCIEGYSKTLEDNGTYVLPAGTLVSAEPDEPTACDLDITLERSRAGQVDPAFDSEGSARGIVQRKVTVSFTP